MSFYGRIFVGEFTPETLTDMAKFSQLKRMGLLLNKLNDRQGTRYVPAEDLLRHIENFGYGSEYGEGEPCSLRTLQRDFKTIDQLFGITIKHCAGRGYYIAERDHEANADSYEALLINFEMLSSIVAAIRPARTPAAGPAHGLRADAGGLAARPRPRI